MHNITFGLQNCTVVVYNMESSNKINALCTANGAMYTRVLMVTSVLRNESKYVKDTINYYGY